MLDIQSFRFNKSSDFVEYLRSIDIQREWFSWREARWNLEDDPPFAETLTEYGIGFTFNLANSSELLNFSQFSNDFRYEFNMGSSRKTKKKPWSTGSREFDGLYVKFYMDESLNMRRTCRISSFMVHHPSELPLTNALEIFEYGYEINVFITPQIIRSDPDLISLTPEERNCYFDGERKLKYFKVYTQGNCELECLSHAGR
jgi:acid-sensing ion channel, other